jgi:hypothetical protein
MDARDDTDAREADGEADQPEPARALARCEPQRENGDEDRHRGIRDGGDAGVDMCLTPGDQQER